MRMLKTMVTTDRDIWRKWLAEHHASEREIWLLFPKRHTGKPSISYDAAVEEALCYGWIDSLIQRIDDDWYARKFTPRTNDQTWSGLNKRRVAKLIKEDRMTDVGLRKVNYEHPEHEAGESVPTRKALVVPPFVARVLKTNSKAWKNFNHLASSYRRNYVAWIMAAKREETRLRRLKDAIRLLAANKRLGLK